MENFADTYRSPPRHRAAANRFIRQLKPPEPASKSLRSRALALLVCASLVGIALAASLTLEHFLYVPNILLVFLPVVLFAAVRYGFWTAALTSLLSIGATGYFTEPLYSVPVSDMGHVWALAMFVAVAAFTSSLGSKVQQRAAAVDQHSRVIGDLYAFSSKLAALSATDELVVEATRQISSMLRSDAILLLPERGTLHVRAGSAPDIDLSPTELQAAGWCWEHGQPAGRGTGMFHEASYLFLPLDTGRGTVGVLGLHGRESEPQLSPDESRLLDALRDQVAVSLDRARLADEIHETEMLAETEKLRTALLTSISHDLKTPLASILGNVSSLRQYGHLYDDATRSEMLAFAEDETLRLSRFVENLLQMTRIDAGALRPTIESVDLSDLIGSALQRAVKRTEHHNVRTSLPADLPMVPLDFVLAEHVLVNLLDNAAKYSPQGSTITISVIEATDRLNITIADEGPGVPEEDLQRIFARFFRAGTSDHRRAGVGLGLAICKGFVEAMGGYIEARNRSDRSGAAFTVSLPKVRSARKAS